MQGELLTAYIIVIAIAAIVAFFCGSVPFALIVGKKVAGIDIREHGSGNTGATNVLRTLGKGPGIIVFICDAAKGALAVFVAIVLLNLASSFIIGETIASVSPLTFGWHYDLALVITGICAIAGHVYSPFLHFHGGKGVSTTLGALLVIMPLSALTAFALFILVVAISRYVSLGSILAALSLPLWSWLYYPDSPVYLVCCAVCAVALVIAHRANIVRLMRHEESKFSIGGS